MRLCSVLGTDVSSILRVYILSTSGLRNQAAMFVGNSALSGGGAGWKYASVPLSSFDDFRVEFEVEATGSGSSLAGYVAIDDVSFTDACRSGMSLHTLRVELEKGYTLTKFSYKPVLKLMSSTGRSDETANPSCRKI